MKTDTEPPRAARMKGHRFPLLQPSFSPRYRASARLAPSFQTARKPLNQSFNLNHRSGHRVARRSRVRSLAPG